MIETQNVEQEVILKKDKEIKKLKVNLKETKDTNKSLFTAVDEFREESKHMKKAYSRLEEENKTQAECIVIMEKKINAKTEVKKVIEMPFVHVRVNKVLSGKFPKTDITISAGGALEQINFDDIGTFTESMIDKIALEMSDAIKKLDPIQ